MFIASYFIPKEPCKILKVGGIAIGLVGGQVGGGEADQESLSDRSQVSKSINGKTRPGTQISWLFNSHFLCLFYIVL